MQSNNSSFPKKTFLILIISLVVFIFAIYPFFVTHSELSITTLAKRTLNLNAKNSCELICNYGYMVEFGTTPDYKTYVHAPMIHINLNESVQTEVYSIFDSITDLISNKSRQEYSFQAGAIMKFKFLSSMQKNVSLAIYREDWFTVHGQVNFPLIVISFPVLATSFLCYLDIILKLQNRHHR